MPPKPKPEEVLGIDLKSLPRSTMHLHQEWMQRRSLEFPPAAARYFKMRAKAAKNKPEAR